MKPETLEQLLIDRALGTLPADVGELIEAYLRSDSTAARAAASFTDTARLAREAIGVAESRTPEFPAERVRSAAAGRRMMNRARFGLSMAACVVFGLGAGWLWFASDAGRPEARRVSPAAPVEVVSLAASRERDTPHGIWSVDRILRNVGAKSMRGEAISKLVWSSPIERPAYRAGK